MISTPIQRGHFELESGLHTDAWLDLDALFLDLRALQPGIDALADQLRPWNPTAVCGPLVGGALVAQLIAAKLNLRFYFTERGRGPLQPGLFSVTYQLPAGIRAHAARERFAVVDDVISAGSSTRATVSELAGLGAQTVVVGALMLLGNVGERYFMQHAIPVVTPTREKLSLWQPQECPLCAAGVALDSRR